MRTFIFFDTNYIYGKKPHGKFLETLIENDIYPFVSEIVVDELKGKNIRQIKKAHDELVTKTKENLPKLYFNLNLEIDLEKCYKESDKRMDKYIKELFNENIIKKDSNSKMMEILLDRNKHKVPPFADANSDKGWVDTLIWVGFLNYCEKNNYDKYIFVTEDNGFLKNIMQLKEEFEGMVNNSNIEIRSFNSNDDVLKYFGLEVVEEVLEEKKPAFIKEEISIKETSQEKINKIRNAIDAVMHTEEYDNFDSWNASNWNISRTVTLEETEQFCNILKSRRNDFLFFSEIDFKPVFEELNVECETKYCVPNNSYNEFINIWEEICKERIDLKHPFLMYVMTSINKMISIKIDDVFVDLPF